MKNDVSYDLDKLLRIEIKNIKETIQSILKMSEIYLFGSIAKGKYSKYSDIDILVLIDEEKSLKDLKELRRFIRR